MSRLFKIAGYAGGILAAFMLFRIAAALRVAGLLLVFSFAFVGHGNRRAWIAVFPLVAALLAAVSYGVFTMLPEDNERLKLLVACWNAAYSRSCSLGSSTLSEVSR